MKDDLMYVAPLIAAVVTVISALIALCIRPSEADAIKNVAGYVLMICGTAWQARNQPKQPGA